MCLSAHTTFSMIPPGRKAMPAQDDSKDRGEQPQRPSRSVEDRERDQRSNRRDQDEYDERDDPDERVRDGRARVKSPFLPRT
jgi:hypothetical protein